MAACERCSRGGYRPQQMFIDGLTFVGPCCATEMMPPVFPPVPVHVLPIAEDLEYGLEVSNKVGIHAFMSFQGLNISYERSPRQIRAWAEKQGLIDHG